MNTLDVKVSAEKKTAKACIESIGPEISSLNSTRSTVRMGFDGRLSVSMKANDLTALRACANTYLRWVNMCIELSQARF